MFQLAIRRGQLERMPLSPKRLEENPPRDGFFEHEEYLKVRSKLPPSFQDVLDFAYYSGWRRNEILGLTWDEVDTVGGVIRLTPRRSTTKTGRVMPISAPLALVLKRRRRVGSPLVFHRDGVTVRAWRTALRDACRKSPRTTSAAARLSAYGPESHSGGSSRTGFDAAHGHKTRSVFDRYNIVNERELLTAGERLAAYVGQKGV